MAEERRQLARNTLIGWSSLAVQVLVSFVAFPLLLDRLPAGHVGWWLVFADFVGHGALLRFGLSSTVLRECAHVEATGKYARFHHLVRTVLTAYLGLGVLLFVVFSLVGTVLLQLLRTEVPASIAVGTLFLLLLQMACAFPFSVYGALLLGKRRFDLEHGLSMLGALLRLGAIVAFVRGTHGLLALAGITLLLCLLDGFARIALVRRILPELRPWPGRLSRRLLRSVSTFSRHAFLVGISGRMIHQLDNLAVGLVLGTRWVEIYEAAFKPVYTARLLSDRVSESAAPSLAAQARRPVEERLREVREWNHRTLLVTALLVVGLLTLGPGFLGLYVGERFTPDELRAARGVLWLLTLALLLRNLGAIPSAVLWGLAKARALARLSIVEGLSNFALSLALAPFLGVAGVALGTVLPKLLTSAFLVPREAGRVLSVPWRARCLELRPLSRPIAAAGTVGVVYLALSPQGMGSWLIASGAMVALFGVVARLTSARRETP